MRVSEISYLTLLECDRVLTCAVALGEIHEAAAADRRAYLNAAATYWHVLRLGADIVERSVQRRLREPVSAARHANESPVVLEIREHTHRGRDRHVHQTRRLRDGQTQRRH
jgi:hypothetical protein